MTTLSDILRSSLVKLGNMEVFTATNGSTTTIVDSDLGGTDADKVRGTMMVLANADSAGAAPENEFAEVTGYTASTGTMTGAASSFTVAPAAGDTYGISNGKDYPHQQMIRSVNDALQSLGDIPKVDTTTLDTAANQTEYAYALAWKRQPPYRVDLQMVTTDADDNKWKELNPGLWYYVPADAGSTGLLVFNFNPVAERGLRVWYRGPHDAVVDYNDVIYEGFHPELVVWQTVYEALLWKMGQQPGDENIIAQLNNAENKRIEMTATHTVWKPKNKSRLLILGRADVEDRFTYPGPA